MINFNSCGCQISDECYNKSRSNEYLINKNYLIEKTRLPAPMKIDTVVKPKNDIILSSVGEKFKQPLIGRRRLKLKRKVKSRPI